MFDNHGDPQNRIYPDCNDSSTSSKPLGSGNIYDVVNLNDGFERKDKALQHMETKW